MFGHNLPGGRVEITSAAVVTQAFPDAQHAILVGRGERLDGGKSPQKSAIVIDHRFDLSLLQLSGEKVGRLPFGGIRFSF